MACCQLAIAGDWLVGQLSEFVITGAHVRLSRSSALHAIVVMRSRLAGSDISSFSALVAAAVGMAALEGSGAGAAGGLSPGLMGLPDPAVLSLMQNGQGELTCGLDANGMPIAQQQHGKARGRTRKSGASEGGTVAPSHGSGERRQRRVRAGSRKRAVCHVSLQGGYGAALSLCTFHCSGCRPRQRTEHVANPRGPFVPHRSCPPLFQIAL